MVNTAPGFRSTTNANPPAGDSMQLSGKSPHTLVFFEYTGRTRLTAIGAITGMKYKFSGPGVIVGVSKSDSYSMSAVPKLKLVTKYP